MWLLRDPIENRPPFSIVIVTELPEEYARVQR